MATAVLDLEFNRLPEEISGLEGYSHALALARLNGVPAGRAYLPVQAGRVRADAVRKAIYEAADQGFWERWLREYLQWDETGPASAEGPAATVAVCTRDRPEDLQRCLEGLARLPDDGQEILVVDSCSAGDETRAVVNRFPGVRYIREDVPGLDRARNRAMRAAAHDIVAFIDDDATPDPNWLRALVQNFDNASVLCVTGLTMPLELETEAQEWFERISPFCRGFSRKRFSRQNLHPLQAHKVGAGANMALRAQALAAVGPFDEALDAGTATHSGGDTEMFARIIASGYQIVYAPAALSWHRHRRTWEELKQTLYGYGVGVYATWTRRLLRERELSVLLFALNWFGLNQLPRLLRSLLRLPGRIPPDLALAELKGCAAGPAAYFSSRRSIAAGERRAA